MSKGIDLGVDLGVSGKYSNLQVTPEPENTWVQDSTYESFAIGDSGVQLRNLDGFGYSGPDNSIVSVYDTTLLPAGVENVLGSKIVKRTQYAGGIDLQDAGVWLTGSYTNVEPITEGDSVWMKEWYFIPSDYQWTSGPKGRRHQLVTSTGGNLGYFDIFFNDNTENAFVVGVEAFQAEDFNNSPTRLWNDTTQAYEWSVLGGRKRSLVKYVKGEWWCLETQIMMGDPGIFRLWFTGRDAATGNMLVNKLIVDNVALKSTNLGSGETIQNHRDFGIWNAPGSPVTQSKYTTKALITNNPSQFNTTDEWGNPIIGSGMEEQSTGTTWPPTDAEAYQTKNFEGIPVGDPAGNPELIWVDGNAVSNPNVGDPTSGFDFITGAFPALETVVVDDIKHTGTRSAYCPVTQDTYQYWGGYFQNTTSSPGTTIPRLYEGDEIWIQCWYRFLPNFIWLSGASGAKGFRWLDNSPSGLLNLYFNDSGFSVLNSSTPENTTTFWDKYGGYLVSSPQLGQSAYALANDGWECIEQKLKISAVNGVAEWKIWRNGELFMNDDTANIEAGGYYISGSGTPLYFSESAVWDGIEANGDGRRDCWMDDIKIVVNGTPGAVDSFGNPYIGIESGFLPNMIDTNFQQYPLGVLNDANLVLDDSSVHNIYQDTGQVTVVDTPTPPESAKCLQWVHRADTEQWGGNILNTYSGDSFTSPGELWTSARIYLPSADFSIGVGDTFKFIRIYLGANGEDWIIWRLKSGGGYDCGTNSGGVYTDFSPANLLWTDFMDQWVEFELYVKFDPVANNCIERYYLNGNLLHEEIGRSNMTATRTMWRIEYWPEGHQPGNVLPFPSDFWLFVDKIRVTNDNNPPDKLSSDGNSIMSNYTPVQIEPLPFTATYKNVTSDDITVGTTWTKEIPTGSSDTNQLSYVAGTMTVDGAPPGGIIGNAFRADILQCDFNVGGYAGVQSGPILCNGKTFQHQVKLYFPTGFDFETRHTTCNPTPGGSDLKWLRPTMDSLGSGISPFMYMLSGGGFAGTQLRYEPEWWQVGEEHYNTGPLGVVVADEWQTWTYEVVCSTDPFVGRVRMWVDKSPWGADTTLVFDSKIKGNFATLKTASDTINAFKIIETWNSGSPTNQTYYSKDIIITDETNPIPFTDGVPDIIGSTYPSLGSGFGEDRNFELGTVGNNATGIDGFDLAYLYTEYSNAIPSHSGSQCAKCSITLGSTGKEVVETWGGEFLHNVPARYEGDEFWIQVNMFFPVGFNFDVSGQGAGMKMMRLRTTDASNNSEGWFDLLVRGTDIGDVQSVVGSEIDPDYYIHNAPDSNWKSIGPIITRGEWHTFEMYVKFHSVRGQAIYRTWADGELLLEDTTSYTLRSATSKSTEFYLLNFFNGGSLQTQSCYVDDVRWTSSTPSQTDAQGNAMIGPDSFAPSLPITGITFDWSTHERHAGGSDNFPMTWAANGNQYTVGGDGTGWDGGKTKAGLYVVEITGDKDNYVGTDKYYSGNTLQIDESGKSYAIIALGNTLYMYVGPGSGSNGFNSMSLYKSTDNGLTWNWSTPSVVWDETETDACKFGVIQMGQNYNLNTDGYLYFFIADRVVNSLVVQIPGNIWMARVPVADIENKAAYEWFSGTAETPTWDTNYANKTAMFNSPDGVSWTTASIQYIPDYNRYMLITEHTATFNGNMDFYEGPTPWGPWTSVVRKTAWPSVAEMSPSPEAYNPTTGSGIGMFYMNFAPKWFANDGTGSGVAICTGIGSSSWDSFNSVEIQLTTD